MPVPGVAIAFALGVAGLFAVASKGGGKKHRRILSEGCAKLVDWTPEEWQKFAGNDAVALIREAFDKRALDGENDAEIVRFYVDYVVEGLEPECFGSNTIAYDDLWKAIFCEVVLALVLLGKLDEEPEDVIRMCGDPTFNPRKSFGKGN